MNDPNNLLARALSTADMILEECDVEGGGGAEVIDTIGGGGVV